MANDVIYLFPDTNVFIQCRPLEELDWSEWSEFKEVHLIVCRPVQREIDNQKNRGNDRVAKRARKTYQVFRRIIASKEQYWPVTDTGPRVRLCLESPSLPSGDRKDVLDYSKPDDEIVGCLDRFEREHQDKEVRLLTHDVGPMMTAKSLGLKVDAIKEEWLLRPEHSESEREIARLRDRITELEQAEPKFRIWFVDGEGQKVESIHLQHRFYEPMSNEDIAACIQSLKKQFPLATDFGSRERAEKDGDTLGERLLGMRYKYTPATDEAIAKYTDQDYPEWIRECEELLSHLHDLLQSEIAQPAFNFAVVNEGTRPGNDALINIVSGGNFRICPPLAEDDEMAEGKNKTRLSLPDPPRPPRGRWRPKAPSLDRLTSVGSVWANQLSRLENSLYPSINSSHLLSNPVRNYRRDPNAFYYKPDRSETPEESFSLECEQWRHGAGEECFSGQLFFDRNKEEVSGAISCEIHAENLSTPEIRTFPVKISIKKLNSGDRARLLIQSLLNRAK